MHVNTKAVRRAVGARIRLRRLALGWDQKKFGDKVGLDQSMVSKLEHGDRMLKIEEAIVVADVLDTSVAYLSGETDEGLMPAEAKLPPLAQRDLFESAMG